MTGYFRAITEVSKASTVLRSHLRQLRRIDYDAFYKEFDIEHTNSKYVYNPAHFNRCQQYIKAFGLLALSIADLLGRPMSNTEFKSLLLLAHLAPVTDDLFEEFHVSRGRMKVFITRPEKQHPANPLEHLFIKYYSPFRELLPDPLTTERYLVHLAGIEAGGSQTGGKKPENAESTLEKGGYACLAIRSIFPEKITPPEEHAMYELGKLTQVMDDLFDAAEDVKANRTTFISYYSDLSNIESYYLERMGNFCNSIKITQHRREQVDRFTRQAIILLSPAMNCIQHYSKLGIDQLTSEALSKYNRHELVCDMESMPQVVRLFAGSVRNIRRLS